MQFSISNFFWLFFGGVIRLCGDAFRFDVFLFGVSASMSFELLSAWLSNFRAKLFIDLTISSKAAVEGQLFSKAENFPERSLPRSLNSCQRLSLRSRFNT